MEGLRRRRRLAANDRTQPGVDIRRSVKVLTDAQHHPTGATPINASITSPNLISRGLRLRSYTDRIVTPARDQGVLYRLLAQFASISRCMTDVDAREKPTIGRRRSEQLAAGSEEMLVMTPRDRVLTAIAAFWLGTIATADAQQKLTITIVTQPFWYAAAVHQSRSADPARRTEGRNQTDKSTSSFRPGRR